MACFGGGEFRLSIEVSFLHFHWMQRSFGGSRRSFSTRGPDFIRQDACWCALRFGCLRIVIFVVAVSLIAACIPEALCADELERNSSGENGNLAPNRQGDVLGAVESKRATTEITAKAMEVLKIQCHSCHSESKRKGGFVLESRESVMKGSDNGAVILPGDPSKSVLTQALIPDADPHMPPKKQLANDEIEVLREWVTQGAEWDDRIFRDTMGIAAVDPSRLGALPDSYHPVLALALSGDDTRLAVGRGSRINVYEAGATNHVLLRKLEGHRDAVQSLAWSADGKWIASGGFRRIVIWKVESFAPSMEITNLTGRITALAFTPDSMSLFGADGIETSAGLIRAWDVGVPEPRASWVAHDDSILDLEVSPDGKLLASAAIDKLVKLWRIPSFEPAAKLEGHIGLVTSVSFNPDGTRLASGSEDAEVKIWDAETGDQTAAVSGHPGPITGLAWTADGKKILTICEDGSVSVCDESKKRPEKTLGAASDILYALVISKDGNRRYSGCHDGLVYVWNAEGKLQEKLGERLEAQEQVANAINVPR